ncbi:MAG: hypothetical protein V1787_00760 [Candidatus Micrarchaeota archaeon]
MNVVEDKKLTNAEAKALLTRRKKDAPEMGYEQANTLEYLEKFTHLDADDAAKMRKELGDLGFLEPGQITDLANVLPKKEETVRAVLTREKLPVNAEQVKEVLKVCKKYAK